MHETEAGVGVGVDDAVVQRRDSVPCAEIYVSVAEAATYVMVGEMDAEIGGEAGGVVEGEQMALCVISVVSVKFGPSAGPSVVVPFAEPSEEPFEKGSLTAFDWGVLG